MAASSSSHSVPLMDATSAATARSAQGTMPPTFDTDPYSEDFLFSVSAQLLVILFDNLSCYAAGLSHFLDAL